MKYPTHSCKVRTPSANFVENFQQTFQAPNRLAFARADSITCKIATQFYRFTLRKKGLWKRFKNQLRMKDECNDKHPTQTCSWLHAKTRELGCSKPFRASNILLPNNYKNRNFDKNVKYWTSAPPWTLQTFFLDPGVCGTNSNRSGKEEKENPPQAFMKTGTLSHSLIQQFRPCPLQVFGCVTRESGGRGVVWHLKIWPPNFFASWWKIASLKHQVTPEKQGCFLKSSVSDNWNSLTMSRRRKSSQGGASAANRSDTCIALSINMENLQESYHSHPCEFVTNPCTLAQNRLVVWSQAAIFQSSAKVSAFFGLAETTVQQTHNPAEHL